MITFYAHRVCGRSILTPHSTLLTPQNLFRQLRQTISSILLSIQDDILDNFKLILRNIVVCDFR